MGIKLAKALGNDVMAISSSAHKEALAKEKGATLFACSKVRNEFTQLHCGKKKSINFNESFVIILNIQRSISFKNRNFKNIPTRTA